MTSRAGRISRDSSLTSCMRVVSRLSPRTMTSLGNNDTNSAASGDPKVQ